MRLLLIGIVLFGLVFVGLLVFGPSSGDAKPGAVIAFFGDLALKLPGATYVPPGRNPLPASPDSPGTKAIPAGLARRLVRLELVSGPSARVTYTCSDPSCPRVLCLLKPPASAPGCARDAGQTGSLLLVPSGGQLRVETLSTEPVAVAAR